MPKISNSIKSGDFNEFDGGVRDASGAVCALTESAAQVCTYFLFLCHEHIVYFITGTAYLQREPR